MSRMKQVLEMVKDLDWDELDAERDRRTGVVGIIGDDVRSQSRKAANAIYKINRRRANNSLATGG